MNTCLRCRSDSLIPDVRVIDQDGNGANTAQKVEITRKPRALVFKDHLRVETTARVCGDCGFVEITAVNPGALWDAYIERSANTFKQ